MTKSIDAAMQTVLDGHDWPLVPILLCTRLLDGFELGVTSHDRQLSVSGKTYEPFGLDAKDLSSEPDGAVGSTEVGGILDSASITEEDIRIGLWDFATWQMWLVNWENLSIPPIELGSGSVGTVRSGRSAFWAEIVDRFQAMQNGIGVLNSPRCIHELGDANAVNGRGNGCTVNLATFTVTGTLTSVASDLQTVADTGRAEADAFFSNGKMYITSGVYSGMPFHVRAYLVGTWVLFNALPADLTGETYSMIRGCDKLLTTCRDVYGKAHTDRLASDWTQGGDRLVQPARSQQ